MFVQPGSELVAHAGAFVQIDWEQDNEHQLLDAMFLRQSENDASECVCACFVDNKACDPNDFPLLAEWDGQEGHYGIRTVTIPIADIKRVVPAPAYRVLPIPPGAFPLSSPSFQGHSDWSRGTVGLVCSCFSSIQLHFLSISPAFLLLYLCRPAQPGSLLLSKLLPAGLAAHANPRELCAQWCAAFFALIHVLLFS
jgi:hypothetical protein